MGRSAEVMVDDEAPPVENFELAPQRDFPTKNEINHMQDIAETKRLPPKTIRQIRYMKREAALKLVGLPTDYFEQMKKDEEAANRQEQRDQKEAKATLPEQRKLNEAQRAYEKQRLETDAGSYVLPEDVRREDIRRIMSKKYVKGTGRKA
jgi:hypothetical protein